MSDTKHIQQIACADIAPQCTALESRGFRVFIIDSPADAAEFFADTKDAFPLDPPISGNVNWDAFADSLWGGLDASKESKIALVIRDATKLVKASGNEFQIALECLSEAAREVEAEKRHEGSDQAEIIVLIGDH